MKNLLALFVFLLPLELFTQTDIFLSDPVPVSPDNTYGSVAPRIVLLGDGNPVVYWGKTGSSSKMYIAVWEDGSFTDPMQVPTNWVDVDLWGSGLGPQIAAFDQSIFLVYEAYGEGIYLSRSIDGGSTFESPQSVWDVPPGRVGTLPSIGVDPLGNPIISFVSTNLQEGDALYEIVVSNDGGQTFETSVVANLPASGTEVCECCPASIVAPTESDIFLTFRNNDANIRDIWVSKSSDGGLSFDEATDIDATDWEIFFCPSSGPDAVVSGDSLVAVFFSGQDASRVHFSTLNSPDMSAGYQQMLPTYSGDPSNQNYPRIAGTGDTLGIVWQESTTQGQDVVLAYSISGTGQLTQQLVKVGEGELSQRYPDIAFANGVFHLVYEDLQTGSVMYRGASLSPITNTDEVAVDDPSIRSYPNPFSESLTLEWSDQHLGRKTVRLFDMQGRLVWTGNTDGQGLTISTSAMPSGTYFLEIPTSGKVIVRKFIKL